MILINSISLQRGLKQLLNDVSLTISKKQKIGLVGKNGSGKTSFFSLILGDIHPDKGNIQIGGFSEITHLSQDIPRDSISATEYVMRGDKELTILQNAIKTAELKQDHLKLANLYSKMQDIDGYSAESRARKILSGLGFTDKEHEKLVNTFSGGWRMRLNLAQTLMSKADLMLLDEPTNHLDLDAIVWLEDWLNQYPGTLLLISHDREFLDNVVTTILHVDGKKIFSYSGNFSSFEEQRELTRGTQNATFEKQQEKIDHAMQFINRFRSKASKARQVQSRVKALQKMKTVPFFQEDSSFSFEFKETRLISSQLLSLENVTFGYDQSTTILENIDFLVSPGDRIGLLGRNGIGKTTLLKLIAGALHPLSGNITKNQYLNIGYFAQHQVEQLHLAMTPLWHFENLPCASTEQEHRNFLGKFNFSGDMVNTAVGKFSGGEKARLVLAMIVFQAPNLLLLDEPTNHLDLDVREALQNALQNYPGAIILVSHDRYLMRSTADQLYLISEKHALPYDGDLDDYKVWLLSQASREKIQSKSKRNYVQEKIQNKKLESTIAKIEKQLDDLSEQKKQLEAKLYDNDLYETDNSAKLSDIQNSLIKINEKIKELEKQWDDVQI